MEGVLTIRAFYSKDFEDVINEDGEFQLDYDFAPSKIKRYIEPVEIEDESGTENNEGNNPSQENKDSTNGDSSKVKEQPSVETPKEDKPSKPSIVIIKYKMNQKQDQQNNTFHLKPSVRASLYFW